jgi:hypothetical protein
MTEMGISDWQAGSECERHNLAYCADCRDLAKIVRRRDGSLGMADDCAVQTFAEITGADYAEALEILLAAGYVPGMGTWCEDVREAFAAAGYATTERHGLTPDSAAVASQAGRAFYVSAQKGRKGHAWSIADGIQRRAYRPPFRYRIFEVTA